MAIRGKRPTSNVVKLITGNPGRRPIQVNTQQEVREGPLLPPKRLTKTQAALWQRFVDPAHWLTEFDSPKAYVWATLMARYLDEPAEFTAAWVAQLRLLGSELGLDATARARMGVTAGGDAKPTDRFFE